MLEDVKEDLTRKYRELKIWIQKFDDTPEFSIERGLYYVYVYGIFEWLVTSVVQRTIEEINSYNGKISEYIYEVYPLIFSKEFDGIQGSGNKTKWPSRESISTRLLNDDNVSIDSALIPTDGRNIQQKQLQSIASAFGNKRKIFSDNRIIGYLKETVENRNHIAHGDETPAAIGSRNTKKDIESNFAGMQNLSECFLDQYDQYIEKQEYLKNSQKKD